MSDDDDYDDETVDSSITQPPIIKVGWIGTGVMGKSMAGHLADHLIKNGHTLLVHNRTANKADELVKIGATYYENPQDVAKEADFLFLMLGFPSDVKSIVFGSG